MMKQRVIFTVLLALISLNASAQKSIKAGMREIERRYDKSFAYDSSLKVNVDYKGKKLSGDNMSDDLNRLFAGSDFDYSIEGEHIILKRAPRYKVSGRVVDIETGEPLIGASVLAHADYTFTDNDGCFEFDFRRGGEVLQIEYISYIKRRREINVDQDMQLTIELAPNENFIDEVVVTTLGADKRPLSKVNKQGTVAINTRKMESMPSLTGTQDVLKFLQTVPGVSAGSDGSSKIYIRGGMADQTQILLDDVPIYNASHAFGYVSLFSGESVSSMDIYKGYTSPSMGGRLSGVVDMKMKEGDRNSHNQTLQVGLITLEASADGPINKGRGSYALSGRLFTPSLLLQASKSLELGLPMYNFYDLTAKVVYDLNDRHALSLSGYSGSDNMGLSISNDNQSYFSNGSGDWYENESGEKYEFESGMSWGNSIGSLALDSKLSDRLSMRNLLYYSRLNNNLYYNYILEDSSNSTDTSSRSDEFGVRSAFDLKLKENYSLDFGAHASYQIFKPQHFVATDNGVESKGENHLQTLTSYALYANNNIELGNLNFDLGLRAAIYNNGEAIATTVEPRLSASYDFDATTSAWISATRNSQPLFSLGEKYLSIPVDFWTPYSGDKLPIADQVSLGARRELFSSLMLTAELYYKHTSNMGIIYNSEEYLLEGLGIEQGDGDAYGAEFMAQYTAGRFSAVGSYAYSNSTIVVGDIRRDFDYDTPHSANFLMMLRTVEKVNKKHTLSINLTYRTGRPFTLSNEVYEEIIMYDNELDNSNSGFQSSYSDITNYDPLMTVRLPDYFRADISYSMEKRLRHGSRTWQFSVTNFTNRKNPHFIVPNIGFWGEEPKANTYKAVSLLPIMPSFSYIRKF